MTFQRDQQVYGVSVGTTSTNATYIATRDPNVNDVNFPLGKFWQNTSDESLWYLNSFSSSNGFLQAAWINIESSIATLSDTADTPVSASSGLSIPPNNIQLTSLDGSVTILSDPPNNRIEFSVSGGTTSVKTLTGDSGVATPVAGNINVIAGVSTQHSGSSVSITGSGSTLTLNVSDALSNTLIGNLSGNATITGSLNAGVGVSVLRNLTSGIGNSAFGELSLQSVTTGGGNTSLGQSTGSSITTGQFNTLLGYQAGLNYTSSESSNILIGSGTAGTLGESNVLRIGNGTGGSGGNLSKAFISGINGVTVSNTKFVTINSSTDQLGVISASSLIFTWNDVTGTTQAVSASNGYISDNAGTVTFTLPASSTLGDEFRIVGLQGAWTLHQNANQQIKIGSSATTIGVGGSLSSTNSGDSIELVASNTSASSVWIVMSMVGNITVV